MTLWWRVTVTPMREEPSLSGCRCVCLRTPGRNQLTLTLNTFNSLLTPDLFVCVQACAGRRAPTKSPMTLLPMQPGLVPNHSLRSLIREWQERQQQA